MEAIFGMEKTTFLAASESYEQDTLFIEITSSRSRVSGVDGGKETARVVGTIVVFSQDDRLTYGFFTKRIENASADDKAPLFFYDIDVDDVGSLAREQNLHERRTSFVFLYESQYDPDKGTITDLTLTLEE
jgi:hypothetical protein